MDEGVEAYFAGLGSSQRRVCVRLRELVLETFPGIEEGMRWGVPVFGGGLFYLVALKDHVNLGFSIAGLSKEEISLFEGGGKTMKHLAFKSVDEVNEKRVVGLLMLVWSKKDST